MLNPQEQHEQAIHVLKILDKFKVNHDSGTYKIWQRANDEAVAAYYGYKTVGELELAGETCWR